LTKLLIPTIFGLSKGVVTIMPISGKEMLKRFQNAGWKVLRQKGSHVIIGLGNERETIPMHKELKKGLEAYLLKRLKDQNDVLQF